MKIYIHAMADSRKEVERGIKAVCSPINEHVIKLILYPDCEAVPHWRQEIYSFLNEVSKLKGSNKFPTYNFILDALSIKDDMLDGKVDQVKANYDNLAPKDVPQDVIESCVKEYHRWLASMLSTKGLVNKKEVNAALDQIIEGTY